jgi:hypothetical protein
MVEILKRIPPGLIIDVGASDGHKSDEYLEVSPNSSVIAIEPFSGNLSHLHGRFDGDPRV